MQVNVECGSLTLWHFKTDPTRAFISLTMNRIFCNKYEEMTYLCFIIKNLILLFTELCPAYFHNIPCSVTGILAELQWC